MPTLRSRRLDCRQLSSSLDREQGPHVLFACASTMVTHSKHNETCSSCSQWHVGQGFVQGAWTWGWQSSITSNVPYKAHTCMWRDTHIHNAWPAEQQKLYKITCIYIVLQQTIPDQPPNSLIHTDKDGCVLIKPHQPTGQCAALMGLEKCVLMHY